MSVNPPQREFGMRDTEFVILGAGALGSILGAHLARAGHPVVMLARGQRADTVSRAGLTITGLADFTAPVTVMTEPAQLRSAEVLIVATKTPGTREALHGLRSVDIGATLSVQNGVQKNELLTEAFGAEQVLGCLADTSGELLADGRVVFTRNVKIQLGELSGGLSQRAHALATVINSSGVRASAVPDILRLEWSKYVTWVGLFALSVLTRSVTWRFMTDPDSALVLVRMTREMGLLAAALGVELTDEANLPAASLCRGSEAAAVAEVVSRGRVFELHAPEHRMSALQDVIAGRPLEVHETLGYAVQKAAQLGIAMPLVEGLYRVIAAWERTRAA